MPKFKKNGRWQGARHRQPIYKKGPGGYVKDKNGKLVKAGETWRGYDWVELNGERVKTPSVTGRTRAEVDMALKKVVEEMMVTAQLNPSAEWIPSKGVFVDAKPCPLSPIHMPTLNDAIAAYLESDDCRARSTTQGLYNSYWRVHIKVPAIKGAQALGERQIYSITRKDLGAWDDALGKDRISFEIGRDGELVEIQRKGLTPKSFAEVRNFLRSIFNFCLAEQRNNERDWNIRGNVAGDYAPKRIWSTKSAIKGTVPMKAEFEKLVDAAKELGLESFIPMMALVRHCLRPGEARALAWTDWDEARHGFYIRHQIQCVDGHEQFTPCKTEDTVRFIKIAASLFKEIAITRGKSKWVCPSPTNKDKWVSDSSSNRYWQKISKKAGVDCTLYMLKTGMVTELRGSGHDAAFISKLTGHSSSKMVEEIYTVDNGEMLQAAIDAL